MKTKQCFMVLGFFSVCLACGCYVMKNIYRLFSLLKTDQGKQLKQKETNCFSIHLIIELWLKELPFWYYQKDLN